MSTALRAMAPAQRIRFRAAYLTHLRARDGVPDLRERSFDVRERFFERIDAEPVRWEGASPVDPDVFARNHVAPAPEPGLDAATLWALATAKVNRAEQFGVEMKIDHVGDEVTNVDDPYTYIQVEETYHTRILRDVLATLGLQMEVATPQAGTRLLIRGMVHMPEGLANVAILCGEIFGVAVFSLLLDKARELFAAQPVVLERMEELFAQILVDEVGHVHFVRSTLGPAGIRLARWMLPVVANATLRDIPELVALFGREAILTRVLAADVDGAAAGYEDRMVVEG
ncbi:MAG: hypothetical protein H6732_01885 [Alphaproteobacteria bacterium]|nr:hypothetical protein [Alphaproteobacteria bacterium]